MLSLRVYVVLITGYILVGIKYVLMKIILYHFRTHPHPSQLKVTTKYNAYCIVVMSGLATVTSSATSQAPAMRGTSVTSEGKLLSSSAIQSSLLKTQTLHSTPNPKSLLLKVEPVIKQEAHHENIDGRQFFDKAVF